MQWIGLKIGNTNFLSTKTKKIIIIWDRIFKWNIIQSILPLIEDFCVGLEPYREYYEQNTETYHWKKYIDILNLYDPKFLANLTSKSYNEIFKNT